MRRLLQQLFDTSKYDNLINKERARLVYVVASVLIPIDVFLIILVIFAPGIASSTPSAAQSPFNGSFFLAIFSIFLAGLIATFVVTRRGNSQLGGLLIAVLATAVFSGLTSVTGAYKALDGLALVIAVALGGLLLGRRGVLAGTTISILCFIISVNLRSKIPPYNLETSTEIVITSLLIFIIGSLI